MQFKALTVAVMVAVLAGGLISPAHTKALSQTTTNLKQSSTVKTVAQVQPKAEPTQVTVATGDTLSAVAAKYGTTYVRVFDANAQITDPDIIYSGENITIPTGSEQLPDRYGQYELALAQQANAQSSEPVAPQTVSQPASQPTTETQSSSTQTTPAVTPVVAAPAVSDTSVWVELANCESGGNWSIDTGNGFYGGLQFTASSWHAMGGVGLPNQASEAEQIALAQKLQAVQGWGAWPVCSAKIGL